MQIQIQTTESIQNSCYSIFDCVESVDIDDEKQFLSNEVLIKIYTLYHGIDISDGLSEYIKGMIRAYNRLKKEYNNDFNKLLVCGDEVALDKFTKYRCGFFF